MKVGIILEIRTNVFSPFLSEVYLASHRIVFNCHWNHIVLDVKITQGRDLNNNKKEKINKKQHLSLWFTSVFVFLNALAYYTVSSV